MFCMMTASTVSTPARDGMDRKDRPWWSLTFFLSFLTLHKLLSSSGYVFDETTFYSSSSIVVKADSVVIAETESAAGSG
jgi:hypothetical protein